MSERLGIALVGAGRIALDEHLPAWRSTGQVDLRWVVDSDEAAAQRAAVEWEIPRWGTSLDPVLDDDTTQAVDVCTPPASHVEICSVALASGRHVLVEKPPALNLEDLRTLKNLAEHAGVVLMVAENWPFSSAARHVDQVLSGPPSWQINLLQARHESDLWLARSDPVVRRDKLGYLFAAGIHSVSLARHLVGDVDHLAAFAKVEEDSPQYPVDTDLVMAARFESGAIGSFSLSGRSRHLGKRHLLFRLIAEQGVIEFDVLRGRVCIEADDQRIIRQPPPSLGYREEIEHFVHCIETGQRPITSIDDQFRTVATVLAAYRSMRYGSVESPRNIDQRVLESNRHGPEVRIQKPDPVESDEIHHQ